MLLGCACALGLVLGSALTPAPAAAADFRVYSLTVGDAYQLVTSGNEVLNRRRLHQYVGFGAYHLLDPEDDTLSISALFRFDADFGLSDREREDVKNLRKDQLSIPYVFIQAKDVAGFLDVTLGRQLHADALDYLMMDGGIVTVKTPLYFGVELIGGLEVKESLSDFNVSAFELDGVRFLRDEKPADKTTVVLGAALVTEDLTWTRAWLGYRRLFSGGYVDQEKVGGSFYQRVVEGLHVNALASYDLYNGRFDKIQAGIRWQVSDAFDVEGEYLRMLPSFDADSIFNIFTAFALNDGHLKLRWHGSADSQLYVGGMVRFFGNEGYGAREGELLLEEKATVVEAWGAMGGIAQRFGRDGRLHLDASWETGYGGDRLLVDLGGAWAVVPEEWQLDARATAILIEDALQPNLETFGFGYQLGASYLVEKKAAVSLMVEQNFNRLQTQSLRVLAVVDLDFWL